jgi:transposase
MLRMIDRHAVQQMLRAGVRIREVARHFEVSRRTIERIRKKPAVEGAEDAVARWKPLFTELPRRCLLGNSYSPSCIK